MRGLLMLLLLLAGMQTSAELRDPTRPAGWLVPSLDNANEATVALQLQAIFFNPGRSSVIINGRSYHEGDAIGDRNIEQIKADRVVLRSSEGEMELKLTAPLVKQRRGTMQN